MATSQSNNQGNPTNINVNINDLNFYADLQNQVEDIAKKINNNITSLLASNKIQKEEISNIKSTYRDLGKELKELNSLSDKYNNNQLKTRDISKAIAENNRADRNLSIQIVKALNDKNFALAGNLQRAQKINNTIGDELLALEEANKYIDERIGLTGVLIKSLGKIPFIGNFLKTDEAITEMRALAKEGASTAKIITTGFSKAFEGLSTGAVALAAFKFFKEAAFKADQQVTELAKSLGVGKDQANGLRQNFVEYSRSSGEAFVTTNRLVKAQSELSQELGVAGKYTGKQAEDFSRLTELIGLSASEAGKLSRLSIINNKSIEETTKSVIKGSAAAQRGNKISIDQRTILKDVANLSEGILIKFQGNPEALGQAVVQARRLGTNLETVDKIGESLLNFETSIENELKAELITGRQINLEKARYASLTGNQLELTRAITDEVGNLNDFQNMNVIAQKSLADAFGLSRDELSKMLLEQEKFNKLGDVSKMTLDDQLKALRAQGEPLDSALYKQIQQQSAADKFNNAVEKLQDLIGNLIAGPLGRMLDMFADIAKHAAVLYGIMGALAGLSLVKMIGSLTTMAIQMGLIGASAITTSTALTIGIGVPLVLAGIGTLMGYMLSAQDEATSNIPKYAKGGITTKPHVGIVGEAGPEAIIPLNSPQAMNILGGGLSMEAVVSAIDRLNSNINGAMSRPAIAYVQGENPFIKNIASNANFGSQQMIDTYSLA
jgi:hypothetical protein